MSRRVESIIDVPQKEMSSDLFMPSDILKPDVRQLLLGLAAPFTQWGKVVEVFLIGSLTTKLYTGASDIDVTLVIEPFSDDSLKAAKTAAGESANQSFAPGTRHAINFFVRDNWDESVADQVYDVISNKWIKQTELPVFDIQRYIDSFEKVVHVIDITQGELKRDLVDYDTLNRLSPEQVKELQTAVQKKIDEIDFGAKKLASTYKVIHSLRKIAFKEPMTPEEIRQYHVKNLLPINVIYKLLEKYHYTQFLQAIAQAIKGAGGEIEEPKDVTAVKKAMDVSIESMIDEMTTSGAAGAYDVPLGARPQGRRCRVKRKKKRVQPLV
jgi:predicted nucleotidyltransferase